jgi:hypothetical protein
MNDSTFFADATDIDQFIRPPREKIAFGRSAALHANVLELARSLFAAGPRPPLQRRVATPGRRQDRTVRSCWSSPSQIPANAGDDKHPHSSVTSIATRPHRPGKSRRIGVVDFLVGNHGFRRTLGAFLGTYPFSICRSAARGAHIEASLRQPMAWRIT